MKNIGSIYVRLWTLPMTNQTEIKSFKKQTTDSLKQQYQKYKETRTVKFTEKQNKFSILKIY
jgi:hypothetical protein